MIDFCLRAKLQMIVPILFSFFFFCPDYYGQIKVETNLAIDDSSQINREIINLWEEYLNSKPDSTDSSSFWYNEEINKYKRPDVLSKIYFSPSVYSLGYKPIILSIKPVGELYEIKTMFYSYSKTKNKMAVLATINVYVKNDGGRYKFYNALTVNANKLLKKKVGDITYYYAMDYHFDNAEAVKLKSFIDKFKKKYNFTSREIDYYIGKDFDEVLKYVGFDTYLSMGRKVPSGFSDVENKLVLSGGMGENFKHELIHQYINPLYDKTSSEVFIEGYATLVSDEHLGKPLKWQIKRVNDYLVSHPELNLNNLLEFYELDQYTNPMYIYGAILCDMAMKKGGVKLLEKLFYAGKTEKDFYCVLEDVFSVKQKEMNSFMRIAINKYSKGK